MGARKFAAWLGLVEDGRYQSDEELEIDGDLTDDVYVEDEPSQEISRVSPLPTRRPKPVPPTAAVQKEMADLSRIVSVRPRSYNEARIIGENFRDGIPVIMNLAELEEGEDKRLVDFAAGLIFGLRGTIERVTSKVFLLSPNNVNVTAEDKERIKGGFYNQS